MKKWSYRDIQKDVLRKYRIKVSTGIHYHQWDQWNKMHSSTKTRTIYQWGGESTLRATFDLLYEVGRIESYCNNMPEYEKRYRATQWAADKAKDYGLKIPNSIKRLYQGYINKELDKQKTDSYYKIRYQVKWSQD